MKRDIVEKLEFGCPFKQGTIGEKDAELAEVIMQEAANEITLLRGLLKAEQDDCQCQRMNKNAQWERAERLRHVVELADGYLNCCERIPLPRRSQEGVKRTVLKNSSKMAPNLSLRA